jgi:PhnB protein
MAVNPIPNGYHTVTPYLVVRGAAKMIEFARRHLAPKPSARR